MSSFGVNLGLFGQASIERQLRQTYAKVKNTETMVKRAIVRAVNRTAKHAKRQVVDSISAKVAIKKKDIRRYVDVTKRAKTKSQYAEVTLSKTKRIQLIYFGARQVKKGVTYRIQKQGKRKLVQGAFIMTRGKSRLAGSEGEDFRMVTRRAGKKRYPIAGPLRGPSAWGVYVIGGMKKLTKREMRARLKKELKEEVRTAVLRVNKVIPAAYA